VESSLEHITDPHLEDLLLVEVVEFLEGSLLVQEKVRDQLGLRIRMKVVRNG
jgi:hypothetical protein